jgi:hypothetical protein
MKIIKVDRPVVEGINWETIIVKSEIAKPGETFHQWWVRKQAWMKETDMNVDGIYLYDIHTLPTLKEDSHVLVIRHEYIKKQDAR